MARLKTPRQMERHLKGISNHYRIEILLLIAKNKEITLDEIISKTKGNAKTIGDHTRRLYNAGLIIKEREGNFMLHTLSPYGKKFVSFLKSFQNQS